MSNRQQILEALEEQSRITDEAHRNCECDCCHGDELPVYHYGMAEDFAEESAKRLRQLRKEAENEWLL